MDSLSVDLILAAVVVAVFVIALSGRKIGSFTIGLGGQKINSPTESRSFKTGSLAKFFDFFWGWADYKPQDWSNAPYKRGYGLGYGH
ncbi:MAG: hypothetical protein WCD69_08760 [Xanthobacteraceae bacterium]